MIRDRLSLTALLSLALAASSAAYAADKPTCAVLTFDARSGIPQDQAALLADRFAIELGALGEYTMINRAKMA